MAERFWGFMANSLNVVGNVRQNTKETKAITAQAYQRLLAKEAKKAGIVATEEAAEDVSPEYLQQRLTASQAAKLQRNKQKAYLKKEIEYKLGLRKKAPIVSRQQLKGALSGIGRSIERQKASWDMARSRTAGTTARSIVEPPRRHLSQENFFEHKDEVEVYGDEGLTFFDSTKKGNGERTGTLFGF